MLQPTIATSRRYDRIAAFFHWVTAAALLTQIVVGFLFHGMERGPVRSDWFAWHKTIGVTILVLALIRLAWRLTHRPPPFPQDMPRWERLAGVWSHRLFYVLLIALPATGLLAVSAYTDQKAIALAGGLSMPPIPGVPIGLGESAEQYHKSLVTLTILLVALHLAAAIRHQLFARPARMAGRMPPFRGPKA